MSNKMVDRTSETVQIDEIIDRIRQINPALESGDAAIARELQTAGANPSKWRSRGSVPYQFLYQYCSKHGINMIWLVEGTGSMYINLENETDVIQLSRMIAGVEHDEQSLLESAAQLLEMATIRLEKAGIHRPIELVGDVAKAFTDAGVSMNNETFIEVLRFYHLACQRDIPHKLRFGMLIDECKRIDRLYTNWKK